MAKNRVEERKRQVVSAKKWAAEHESRSGFTCLRLPDGVNLFTPKEAGSYRLDFIPYIAGKGNKQCDEGMAWWERTFFVHRGIGAESQSFCCLKKNWNKKCPICEEIEVLSRKKSSDDDEEEQIKQQIADLAAKERQLFNVIDTANRDKGIQIWEVSYHLFGKHLKNKLDNADEDDRYEFFADLEEGFTLKIGAVKEVKKYTFINFSDIEFKQRSEPYPESMLEDSYCLDSMLKEYPYDELKKIFHGVEEEAVPPSNGKAVVSKPVTKPVDDDDDDMDDDEPDPIPAKKVAPLSKFKQGDFLIYKKTEYEVIRVSPDGTTLSLQDEDGRILRGIDPDDCKKVPVREDAEKQSVKPAATTAKKQPVKDDDDEDEDLDEEDEESDEDDDEGEEDDEEVAEDEPPVPVKRGRGRPKKQ